MVLELQVRLRIVLCKLNRGGHGHHDQIDNHKLLHLEVKKVRIKDIL